MRPGSARGRPDPVDAARWGKRVCRIRSGSPAGALGLVRSTMDSARSLPVPRLCTRRRGDRPRRRPPNRRARRRAARLRARRLHRCLQALDRHEFAALGLTLGMLCFAVVTAIMLVRRARRARRHGGGDPRRDRGAQGRGRSRQCAVAVGAADSGVVGGGRRRARDHRRHRAGDQPRDAAARAGLRHLARARAGAGHGALGRCAARPRRELRHAR